jgi:hypothetical protein
MRSMSEYGDANHVRLCNLFPKPVLSGGAAVGKPKANIKPKPEGKGCTQLGVEVEPKNRSETVREVPVLPRPNDHRPVIDQSFFLPRIEGFSSKKSTTTLHAVRVCGSATRLRTRSKNFFTAAAVSFGKRLSRRGLVWPSIEYHPVLATRSASR